MENKQCVDCGKPMKVRMGVKGQFWGCSGYPNCKHTEPLEEGQGFNKPEPDKVNAAAEMLVSLQNIDRGVQKMVELMQAEKFKEQL